MRAEDRRETRHGARAARPLADLAPAHRLSQALGLAGASMLVMHALAPAVAEALAATAGWRAAFASAAAGALLAACVAARVREPARHGLAAPRAGGLLAVLRRPLVLQYAVIVAIVGAGFGAATTFQQPFALALGRERVSGFFVAFGAGALAVRVGFGSLPDRLGRHRVALGALATYGVSVLAMAGLRPPLLEPLGLLLGVAHGLFFPALNAIAVHGVRADERGRLMAIFTGACTLGLWGGTTGLGLVAERHGYPAVFHVAAAALGIALCVLARSAPLRLHGGLETVSAEAPGK